MEAAKMSVDLEFRVKVRGAPAWDAWQECSPGPELAALFNERVGYSKGEVWRVTLSDGHACEWRVRKERRSHLHSERDRRAPQAAIYGSRDRRNSRGRRSTD